MNEDDKAQFICLVTSPQVGVTFTWYVDGVRQSEQNQNFILEKVTRNDNMKKITCQGNSTDGVLSNNATTVLSVHCKLKFVVCISK